jgi:hypothetical protein
MENPQESLTPVAEATQAAALTPVQERVDEMLANRAYIADKVKGLLIEGVDIYTLEGMKKPSLGKPGAEKLAKIFGLVETFSADHETIAMAGDKSKPFVAFICNLTRNGTPAGQGRGAAVIEWNRPKYRTMSKTEFEKIKDQYKPEDYKGPFRGNYGEFYKLRDGEVYDASALNKAIKMAQKSAHVDAVIRATGVSEIFTQDVEDMPKDVVAPDAPKVHADAEEAEPFVEKKCIKCGHSHTGKYAKCLTCWKKEQPK